LFLFTCLSAITAQNYPLKIVSENSDFKDLVRDSIFEYNPKKPQEKILKPILEDLINRNYLESSIDSIIADSTNKYNVAYLHVGEKYDFSALSFDSLSLSFIKRLKLKTPRNTQEFLLLRESISEYYGNSGYPFCKISLDNLGFDNEKILGHLNVDTGPKIIIDSIQVNGDLKIRNGYINNYLDFKKSEPYNHKKLIALKSQINRLTFLKQES